MKIAMKFCLPIHAPKPEVDINTGSYDYSFWYYLYSITKLICGTRQKYEAPREKQTH